MVEVGYIYKFLDLAYGHFIAFAEKSLFSTSPLPFEQLVPNDFRKEFVSEVCKFSHSDDVLYVAYRLTNREEFKATSYNFRLFMDEFFLSEDEINAKYYRSGITISSFYSFLAFFLSKHA